MREHLAAAMRGSAAVRSIAALARNCSGAAPTCSSLSSLSLSSSSGHASSAIRRAAATLVISIVALREHAAASEPRAHCASRRRAGRRVRTRVR